MALDFGKISKQIELEDGSRIVLLDMLAAAPSVNDEDVERNVYRLKSNDELLWKIDVDQGVYPRTPFTGITLDCDGALRGYRWDGTEFVIEMTTGKARPVLFVK